MEEDKYVFIRGVEIDIYHTMMKHFNQIVDMKDFEKHMNKIIKPKSNTFRFLILQKYGDYEDKDEAVYAYRMYIAHKFLVKGKNNKIFTEYDKDEHIKFLGIKENKEIKFMEKYDKIKDHVILKKNEYMTCIDTCSKCYSY